MEIQQPVSMAQYYMPKAEKHPQGMTVENLIEWYTTNDRDFRVKFKKEEKK